MSFYEGLLGWKYRKMDQSPLKSYVMIEAGDRLIGGFRQVDSASVMTDLSPILYFTVPQLNDAIMKAKSLGAKLVGETVDLQQGRGKYQWIKDREGHVIGLWAAA